MTHNYYAVITYLINKNITTETPGSDEVNTTKEVSPITEMAYILGRYCDVKFMWLSIWSGTTLFDLEGIINTRCTCSRQYWMTPFGQRNVIRYHYIWRINAVNKTIQGPFSMFLLRAYSAELAHEQKRSSLWASSARSFSVYRSRNLLMISKLINTWRSELFWNWS